MLFNDLETGFIGLRDLQEEAVAEYGPGYYIPSVVISYWSSRTMIGIGLLMILVAALAVFWSRRDNFTNKRWFLRIMIPAALLPTAASIAGWLVAETGRWPWIVRGLQKIEDAVSPTISSGDILFSMIIFLVLYSVLGVVAIGLMIKYGTSDPAVAEGKGE